MPALKTVPALILIGVLGAAGVAAGVYTRISATSAAAGDVAAREEPQAQARLVSDFTAFAGSEPNARSLVAGLREGKEIALVARTAREQSGATTRFTPPTRPMDYSSLRVALVLAREQLSQLGITRPTPDQIRAVLVGGGIASRVDGRSSTPFLLPGVLQMRAGGMSWARIAGTVGLTLKQSLNGVYAAEAAVPMDSPRQSAARTAPDAVPTAAAGAGAPALRRAAVTKAAPISSASITTSSAGGPTTRAVIQRAEPARRTPKDLPTPAPRRSKAQVMAEADGTAGKKAATVRAPDSARREAVGTTAAAAASTDEPVRSANDQPVD